jgi:hypothetical protein
MERTDENPPLVDFIKNIIFLGIILLQRLHRKYQNLNYLGLVYCIPLAEMTRPTSRFFNHTLTDTSEE